MCHPHVLDPAEWRDDDSLRAELIWCRILISVFPATADVHDVQCYRIESDTMAAFSMPVHNAGAAGWDDGPAREQVCKHCWKAAVELAIFQLSAVTIK